MALTTYAVGKLAEERILNSVETQLRCYSIRPYIIRDVCYKQKGKYAQVDCVMLCNNGLFCIEIKSWKGKVFPTRDKQWQINNGERKVKFNNPIIQNGRHQFVLNALSARNVKSFAANENFFRSIILFDDKTDIEPSLYHNVINARNFADYISKIHDNISDEVLYDTATFIDRLVKVNKPKFELQQRGIIQRGEESIERELGGGLNW